MATVSTASGLRLDSMVNLGYSFSPTLAMSAKAFETFDANVRSFREPLKRSIQQVLAPSFDKNFRANGRPETWTPYSEDTITMKANDPKNKYGAENILRRSGLLWKTMQQYNIWTVTSTQAAILNLPDKIWYGAIQQAGFGSKASDLDHFASPEELKNMPGGGAIYIPARPFALMQDGDIDKIQEVFANWLQERTAIDLGVRWS